MEYDTDRGTKIISDHDITFPDKNLIILNPEVPYEDK